MPRLLVASLSLVLRYGATALTGLLTVAMTPLSAAAQGIVSVQPADSIEVRAYALSDRLPFLVETELSALERTSLPKQRSGKAPVTSVDAAITAVRRAVADLTTPGNIETLDLITAKADPTFLRLRAAEFIFLQRPAAALALLLRAYDKDRNDLLTLLNLANVFAFVGFGQEALAVLDELNRMTTRAGPDASPTLKAMVLGARGYTLITLGRTSEAAQPLQAALALDSSLAEPARSMSYLLLKQGKRQEAEKLLIASGRPGSLKAISAAGRATPSAVPINPADMDISKLMQRAQSNRPQRKALGELYDLSEGHAIALPEVPRISAAEETYAHAERLAQRSKQYAAQSATRNKRRSELDADVQRRRDAGGISPLTHVLAREIIERIRMEFASSHVAENSETHRLRGYDPEIVSYGRKVAETKTKQQKEATRITAEWGKRYVAAAEAAAAAKATTCKPLMQPSVWATGVRNSSVDEYEKALRDFVAAVTPRVTALVANLFDPAYHELAVIEVEVRLDALELDLWGARSQTYTEAALRAQCAEMARVILQQEAEDAEKRVKVKPCVVYPSRKTLRYKIGLLEAKANCEQISLEVNFTMKKMAEFLAGTLNNTDLKLAGFDEGLFLQGTWKGTGKYTLYAGHRSSFSAGPDFAGVGATLKGGIFIEGSSDGGIEDFGLRVSVSGRSRGGALDESESAKLDVLSYSGISSASAEAVIFLGLD